METFSLTNKAKQDLKNIARFTEKTWGRQQRNHYIKQFDQAFTMIAKRPSLGQDCSFIKEGYLKFPQGSHLIFYKMINGDDVLIVRILHKQMDVRQSMKADS